MELDTLPAVADHDVDELVADAAGLARRTRAIVAEHPEPGDGGPVRLLDRELSWLSFDERVLALAARRDWPPLERARALGLFAANLDRFFQVRVAGVLEQIDSDADPYPGRMRAGEQLKRILPEVRRLMALQVRLLHDEVLPALAARGIRILGVDELTDDEHGWLDEEFESTIFPVLTPLAVDPAHPFPYLSNLSLNLAVLLRSPDDDVERFARVKVPGVLPRFVTLPGGGRLVPLEAVVASRLDRLFPGLEVVEQHVFRVTRNADLTVAGELDEAEDLLDAVESGLSRRRRGQRTVRLEVEPSMTEHVLELLLDELELDADHVVTVPGPLDLSDLVTVAERGHPPLTHGRFAPTTPPALAVEDAATFFATLRAGDVLVHHPYDDFDTTVLRFLELAADDPHVLSIKIALYRMSGDSPLVAALVRAAERGTEVTALVELTARFDEASNVRWARRLEDAGVHVAYGVAGLKTHAKTALVVRREGDRIIRYGHVGTGNYHDRTARTYEDVGVMTADPGVGADLTSLFNALTGFGRPRAHRRLVTAPDSLRDHVLELVARERDAPDGHVVMKTNALVDVAVVEALYEASRAGTRIDLVVRGICCLRPGVPGLSEGIRVRSVVGRYLEHARIYRFGSATRGTTHLIGSGDLMPRNLDHRVEAMLTVTDPTATTRLDDVLDVLLADDAWAWELGPDGAWTAPDPADSRDVHATLQQHALQRGRP